MKARYCIKQTKCKFLRIDYKLGKESVGENRRFVKISAGLIVSATILDGIAIYNWNKAFVLYSQT